MERLAYRVSEVAEACIGLGSTQKMARRYTQVRETQDRAAVERFAEALA